MVILQFVFVSTRQLVGERFIQVEGITIRDETDLIDVAFVTDGELGGNLKDAEDEEDETRDFWTDPTFDLIVAELSIGDDDGEDGENGDCIRRIQTIEQIVVEVVQSND